MSAVISGNVCRKEIEVDKMIPIHPAQLFASGPLHCQFCCYVNIDFICEEIRLEYQREDDVYCFLNKLRCAIDYIRARESMKKTRVNMSIRHRSNRKKVQTATRLSTLMNCDHDFDLVIFNNSYPFMTNVPSIFTLTLPALLCAKQEIQPEMFETHQVDRELSEMKWYKSMCLSEWIEIGSGFTCKLFESDVGYYLKFVCVPSNSKCKSQPVQVISKDVVISMPDINEYPFNKRHKFTKAMLPPDGIRVVSYNVLSDRYKNHMKYCSPDVLRINYRKILVSTELRGYNADIICLQEVDHFIYKSYYKPMFSDYGQFYHRKGMKMPEGLLCLYNEDKFKKYRQYNVVFNQAIDEYRFKQLWSNVHNQELRTAFLRQLTSMQVTVLKTIVGKKRYIIVANTHLFYHPEAEPVRMLQVTIAVTYIASLKKQLSQDAEVAVIFCGDFNSRPVSTIFDFMISGKFNNVGTKTKQIGQNFNPQHNLHLSSACGKPKYTNYTEEFKDCLDYIFISKNLKVDTVIPLPTEKELQIQGPLPNRHYPSDHLALVADLTIT